MLIYLEIALIGATEISSGNKYFDWIQTKEGAIIKIYSYINLGFEFNNLKN